MSSIGLRLLTAIVVPPILVASVLVVASAHLVQRDKELYGYDFATQTVDLLARNLATKLDSLRRRGAQLTEPEPPFVALQAVGGAAGAPVVTNVSTGGKALVQLVVGQQRSARLPPSALLDVARQGPSRLQLINSAGRILAHPEAAKVTKRAKATALLGQLRLFRAGAPRLGTKELTLAGKPVLAAFARLEGGLALVQTIPKAEISAAAAPLIRTAALISGVTVLLTLLVTVLLSRRIVRPLQAMAQQAEAIGRGDFDAAERQVSPKGAGEVAILADSLRHMRESLAQREQDLERVQQRLMQSERLNAVNRVIVAVSQELSEPLEAGLVATQQARYHVPPEAGGKWLDTLATSLDRASGMLQKLRRLDTTGEKTGETTVIDAALAVVDVLLSARPILQQRSIEVAFEPSDPWPIRVGLKNLQGALLDVLYFLAQQADEATTVRISIHDQTPHVTIAFHYRATPLSREECAQFLSPIQAVERGGTLVLAVAAGAVADERGLLTLEPSAEGNVIWLQLPGPDVEGGRPLKARSRRSREITAPTLPVVDDTSLEIEVVDKD
jgi:signal transduction histidine kinase